MRLIDADKLPFDIMPEDVDKAPTIDAVPVVRCREYVKHGTEYCPLRNHYIGEDETDPDDFCSYGQRKEAENEVSEP